MAKKKTKFQLAQEKAEAAIKATNEKIDELGLNTGSLYGKLNGIQAQFDAIRNVPSEKRIKYEQLKEVRLNWKQQADKIEADFKAAAVKNAAGTFLPELLRYVPRERKCRKNGTIFSQ